VCKVNEALVRTLVHFIVKIDVIYLINTQTHMI